MIDPRSTMELMLFGTFEARIGGVSLQRSLSAKGRLLLAFLALSAGRPVATGVIADAVFPDSQAEDPHEIIKKTVQDLRRALGVEAYRLTTPAPRMLALDLEGVACDWAIFHAAIREGSRESLRHAVTVHARPFLEAECYAWVTAEQARCLELRRSALETIFRQALDDADFAAAGSALSQQLTFELPCVALREELWRELLKTLLARQEYGLVHHLYTQLRAFLSRTAGRTPEAETQELYQRIPKTILLQIGQVKDYKRKSAFVPSARLPNFPFALLGRDNEMYRIKRAFTEHRLWTVTGPGGVGKTRFAVQTAQEIGTESRLDVGFIDLTASTPSKLLQTLATALGVKESLQASLYESIKEVFGQKRALLVLDNCEHVVEKAAEICAALLKDCPNLSLLATSRETLRLDGEQALPLPPLDLPGLAPKPGIPLSKDEVDACMAIASVRLFVERAAAVRPAFRLTPHNAETVAALCRLADGIPLCIEMVASQSAGIALERIAEDLADCVLTLEHRSRGIAPRHKNLQAALGWSYGILSPAEQALMRRLAVFSGGWSGQAAEAVCCSGFPRTEEIASLLADLVSKSLVTVIWSDTEGPRFHFLETVRIYALEQLRLAGERADYQRRHYEYFVTFAEEADHELSGREQKKWLETFDSEIANLRRALEVSAEIDTVAAMRLVYALSRYWEIRGLYREGKDWAARLLANTNAGDRSVTRARVLDSAGWFHHILGEYGSAQALLQESLEISREQGAQIDSSVTLIKLGFVALNTQDLQGARTLFEDSLAIRRELGDKRLIAITLLNLGMVVSEMSELALASSMYEEARKLLMEVGDRRMMANCLAMLGELARREANFTHAQALLAESIAVLRELGDKYLLRYVLYILAVTQYDREDFAAAYTSYVECLDLSIAAKATMHAMQCLNGIGNLAIQHKNWTLGVQLWGASERMRGSHSLTLNIGEQSIHDSLVASAVAALGENGYSEALEVGRSMMEDAAYEMALRTSLSDGFAT